MLEIIKTNDGYMVQKDGGDYICDANGDNLWDTYEAAEAVYTYEETKAVFCGVSTQTPWSKANEAFYKWESDCIVGESSLSDDDRRVWVQGYLQALRDAS